ncbi:hypothetical protein TVAG_410190 [Trichomonas vaginalis G3]|uniref:Uncharacterized protein n=1 Tax=Trichomonas vaginalis (strain ATCC PRA-98 / G3) TaxID=412133 RepID=A2E8I2_TRIV3|nr:hypothetical protein TVAGG3_0358880 [Trichomonas vaginalis G3]EAY11019.1 hypothetical protein TVAG_410190 [Trichomonas vaginalis G3]KAI5531807.1 hypothetical protein TVAGG3_0358880 [Trichomonas vaginalis G3]|eukprot:XP_001323242.1 hypothetical protein [Trichomonas vaginalis G3]
MSDVFMINRRIQECVDSYYKSDLTPLNGFINDCFKKLDDKNIFKLKLLIERLEDGIFWNGVKNCCLFDEFSVSTTIQNYNQIKFPSTATLFNVLDFIATVSKCNPMQIALSLAGKDIDLNKNVSLFPQIDYKINQISPPYIKPITELPNIANSLYLDKDKLNKLYAFMKQGNENAYHILNKLPTVEDEIKAMSACKSYNDLFPETNKALILYRLNFLGLQLQHRPDDIMELSKRLWDSYMVRLALRAKFSKNNDDILLAILVAERVILLSDPNTTARILIEDNARELADLIYQKRENENIVYHLLNIIKAARPSNLCQYGSFLDFFLYETSDDRPKIINILTEISNLQIIAPAIDYCFINMEQCMIKDATFLSLLLPYISFLTENPKFLLNMMLTYMYKFIPDPANKSDAYRPPTEHFVELFVITLDKILDDVQDQFIENAKQTVLEFFGNKILFSELKTFPISDTVIDLVLKLINSDNCHSISRCADRICKAKLEILYKFSKFSELMTTIKKYTKHEVKFYPAPTKSTFESSKDDIKRNSDKMDFAKQYYDMLLKGNLKDIDYVETMIFNLKNEKAQEFADRFVALCKEKFPDNLERRYQNWFNALVNLLNDQKRTIVKNSLFDLFPYMKETKEIFKIALYNIQRVFELCEKGQTALTIIYFELLRKLYSLDHFEDLLTSNIESILSFISLPKVFLHQLTLFLDDIFSGSAEFYQKFFDKFKFGYILNLFNEITIEDPDTQLLISLFLAKIVPQSDFVKFLDSTYMKTLCLLLHDENISITIYSRLKNNVQIIGQSQNIMSYLLIDKEIQNPSLYFIVICTLILENYPDLIDNFIQKQLYLIIYTKIVDYCLHKTPEVTTVYFYSLCDFLLVFNTRFHTRFFSNTHSNGNSFLRILGSEYQQNPAFPTELINFAIQSEGETASRLLDLLFSFAILTYSIIDAISFAIPSGFVTKFSRFEDQCQKAAELLCFCLQNSSEPGKAATILKMQVNSVVDNPEKFISDLSYVYEPFFDKKKGVPAFIGPDDAIDIILLWSNCPLSISSPMLFLITHKKFFHGPNYNVWIHNISDIIDVTSQAKNYSIKYLHNLYIFRQRLSERFGILFGPFKIEEQFYNQIQNINSERSNQVITMFIKK